MALFLGITWLLGLGTSAFGNGDNPTTMVGQVGYVGLGTSNLTVNHTSTNAIIQWSQLNIGANETVTFNQCVTCNILNRILDANPSQFLGTLNGQGNLIFLNRNGIFIGPHAQINIQGSFIATSLGISDANFLAGNYLFQGQIGDGLVQNEGTITTQFGGAYLIAPNVENSESGLITSTDGSIVLAAGTDVLLSDQPFGNGLMVQVSAPAGAARNLGSLIADGGHVDMAGLVVNQEGLIQANTVGEKDGKIVLYGKNETNLKAGSHTTAKGGEKSGVNRLRVLAHSDSNTGKTNFEAGAIIDTSGGALGGHGGLAFLHGKQVVNQGDFTGEAQAGFEEGQLLNVVQELTVSRQNILSKINPQHPQSHILFAAMNVIVENGGLPIDFNAFPLPAGEDTLSLSFVAAEDLTIKNPFWGDFALPGIPDPTVWNLFARAGSDLKILGGFIVGANGNRMEFEAGRDVTISNNATILNSPSEQVAGGDIFVNARRDFITSSQFVTGPLGKILTGIRMIANTPQNTLATLDINVGRDIHGTRLGPAAVTVDNGKATIKAGGQIGLAKPEDSKVNDPEKTPFHMQIGENIVANIDAEGDIYLGQIVDIGILEDNTVNGIQNTTVTVTSNQGDIHIDPGRPGLETIGGNYTVNSLKRIYPPSFTAKATEGNIFIDSDVSFWASATGSLDLFAKHNIEGAVTFTELTNEFISVIGTPIPFRDTNGRVFQPEELINQFGFDPDFVTKLFTPRTEIAPTSTPVISLVKGTPENYTGPIFSEPTRGTDAQLKKAPDDFLDNNVETITFTTEIGDIQNLEVDFDSPNFKKEIKFQSGQDINQVFFKALPAPTGITALVSAARDINMKALAAVSVQESASKSGIRFIGNGTGQIKAGRSLDLADSSGIEMVFKLGSNESNKGGLLDIEVQGMEDLTDPSPITGNLEMTSSKIVTRNGASIWIHGQGESLVINGQGNVNDRVTLGNIEGNVLHVGGKEIQEFVTPVTIDDTTPRLQDILNQGDDTYMVNGAPVFTADGRQIHHVQHEGKPIIFINPEDGTKFVVLSAGTQTILAEASHVSIANPVPGNINVGSNSGGGSSVERGILTQRGGSIEIKARRNIDVNRSRIATLGGGNIALTSTDGNISAGSGGRDEVTQFVLDEVVGIDEKGKEIKEPRVFEVPGSGIFTFDPDDPNPLSFPVFDTPAIIALKNEKIKQEFFGRNTSAINTRIEQLVREREPSFREEFGTFLDNTDFGNVRMTARNPSGNGTIIIPPAGIRGADILLDSDVVDFQGGTISGRATFNTDSVKVPPGGLPVIGLASGAATSAGDKTSGTLNALGGSTGTVTTASSTTSATSATTSEALQSAVDTTTENATEEAKAQAKRKNPNTQAAARRALNLREGVTIQVEVKERTGS